MRFACQYSVNLSVLRFWCKSKNVHPEDQAQALDFKKQQPTVSLETTGETTVSLETTGETTVSLWLMPNPAFERDCAKIARVFPDIIGAKAPNAGVKARSPLA